MSKLGRLTNGGGWFAEGLPAQLTNVFVVQNTAGQDGGGILTSSPLTLTGAIIAQDHPDDCEALPPAGGGGARMPSRYWRIDGLHGIDLLRADASVHRYARHCHEGYALGVVEAGAHAFAARGEVWTAIPGRVVVVNPEDAHDGGPAAHADAYSYRMIYVDRPVLTAVIEEAAESRIPTPFFPHSVVSDTTLAERFVELHRALEHPESRLKRETLLTTALVELAKRHGKAAPPINPRARAPRAVTLALEYLTEHFAEDISLAELAGLGGVGRFHLLRAFRGYVGLPPHLYQTQLRLRHARRLMLAGEPPARAAVAAGFADQSHLIRKFKAAHGVTPGQYLGSCNSVQSAARQRRY